MDFGFDVIVCGYGGGVIPILVWLCFIHRSGRSGFIHGGDRSCIIHGMSVCNIQGWGLLRDG